MYVRVATCRLHSLAGPRLLAAAARYEAIAVRAPALACELMRSFCPCFPALNEQVVCR